MKATLVFPIKNGNILLAKKMKKIGAGKWNGFGGKPEPADKSIYHTACRELLEESGGIHTTPEHLISKALIDFYFFDNSSNEPNWSVVIFIVSNFDGQPQSTHEMQNPQWFSLDAIQDLEMLPADKEFIPLLFENETFHGKVIFNENMDGVKSSQYVKKPLEI